MNYVKSKLIHDISASSLQVIINQVCGVVIFYVLSVYFYKNEFGEINWSLAVLLSAFSILSLGIDQVAVKKIAEGIEPQKILSLYFVHVVITGGLFYLLLLMAHFIFPAFHHDLLLFLGFGKLMIFFASPFKQLVNGLEKFRLLFYMSVCSNVIRSILLIVFGLGSQLSLSAVVIIFIVGDTIEFVISVIITKNVLKIPLKVTISRNAYLDLLKGSLPQAGVVIFTSAIARFDWIFLGILASNIALAEYSFAFKVLEVVSLPLLVIAPILTPRFTRIFRSFSRVDLEERHGELSDLFRFEMIISSLVALVLNVLWIPAIDYLTHNKYGAVNSNTILILSGCMPFIYANNFLWNINFARGRLKMIFYTFFVTFAVNVVLDLILIPFYAGNGAAVAYLLAIFVQFILFRVKTENINFAKNDHAILICPVAALVSGIIGIHIFSDTVSILSIAVLIFLTLLIISRQIVSNDWKVIKRFVYQ
jgi:O-antigen/teichoic acid export membrane protein